MSHRPPLTADPVHQQTTTVDIETSISVGHENLRAVRDLDNPHFTRRFSSSSTPTRHQPHGRVHLGVAKDLYDSGRARVILVSGDNRVVDHDEPTAMRDWLVAEGVPEEAVVRDFAGRDTYDSCTRARRIFGVERVLVVSQGYHLPRAVTTCRAVGLDAEGVGDWTARRFDAQWSAGERREKLAAAKTVLDVATGRDPVLGPVETSVQEALAASATAS